MMSPNGILFRILLGMVVLAPLAFGANRPWAWSLLALATGALLAAWSIIGALQGHRRPPAIRPLWPIILPFALVILWAAVQACPFVPTGWRHPLWGEAATALKTPAGGAISLDPARSVAAIMKLLTYAGVFLLAFILGRHRGRARTGIVWLAAAGGLYALYGLAAYLSGGEHILWFRKWAYLDDLTSTFVNRNSYGAYAGLGLLCCLGLVFDQLQPPRTGTAGARYYAELILVKCLPYAIGVLVLASVLLLTHSRGALVATVSAIGILLVCLLAGRVMRPRQFLVAAAFIGLGAGLMIATTGEVTVERMVSMSEIAGDRGQLTRLGIDAIRDAPLSGFGAGAFAPAFRLYRDPSLPRPVVYDYAHDIYIDAVLELGIPAAFLLGVSLAATAVFCLIGLLRRRDQLYPSLALAALGLLLVHGVADFSIEIPAIATTLAFLLGIGVAQSRPSRQVAITDQDG